jgi:hypothetical protein
MKGQAWIAGVVAGVVGIVIAAQVLFSQIGGIKSTVGNATCTNLSALGGCTTQPLTTSEAALAGLMPFVMIAGFILLALAVFLYQKTR